MKVNVQKASGDQNSPQMLAAKESLANGAPLITMIEEVLGPDMVKARLLIPAFGTEAGVVITLKQAMASPAFNSLKSAIEGSQYAAPIRKGDALCFNNVYPGQFEGKTVAMVGQVTARTHDKMRGQFQLMTAMAKLSKASVKANGAHQYLTIAEPTKAMSVGSFDEVKLAWAEVQKLSSPGGSAGFIIRDGLAISGGDWFEKKNESIQAFIELLDQQSAFDDGGFIELIPAWNIRVGRDQMVQDVDLKTETSRPQLGNVSKLFDYGDKRGDLGFLPCTIITADEAELGFGNSLTGNVIRVATGVQRCQKQAPVSFLKLPTNLRKFNGVPQPVVAWWKPEDMAALHKERIGRRGPDEPVAKAKSEHKPDHAHQVHHDQEPRPRMPPPIRMGMKR